LLISLALLCGLVPLVLLVGKLGMTAAYAWFLNVAFERLLILGLFSLVAGWILGGRARQIIGDLWVALFRLILSVIGLTARFIKNLARTP
jgi:uncharacterized membrane protein YfcA